MATKALVKRIYAEVIIKNTLVLILFIAFLIPNISYDFEVLKTSQQG